MINAFKQIRLSNGVLISGLDGRVAVGNSGSLVFTSELNALTDDVQDLRNDFENFQSGANIAIADLQSGVSENSFLIENLYLESDTLGSGINQLFSDLGDLGSGIEEVETRLTDAVFSVSNSLDVVSGNLDVTNISVSGLIESNNALISGLSDVSDIVSVNSIDIDFLKTGLSGVVDVLVSHDERLSGIDYSITSLFNTGLALDSRITSEVSGINNTISSVSGALAFDIAAINTRVDNVLSNVDEVALNSLSEVVAAFQNADQSLSGAISSLATGAGSALFDEIARATGAEGALDVRVTDIENNYFDKRVGGSIAGDLDIVGNITASGSFEVNGGAGSTTFFVGDGVVGVNTETPSEAFEVVGNGKFSGTVEVAAPTLSGHASTKGYVDSLFAKQQSFSVEIPVGIEEMTVSFPGGVFSSVPVIQVSLESDGVVYFHAMKNKTVSGFDISFSDQIQESGNYLNIFASNQ